jgi:hypothetical protein
MIRVTTPVQLRKHASLTGETMPVQQQWRHSCNVRAKRSVQLGQQHQGNKSNNALEMLAMAPVQQRQQCHCDNGNNPCTWAASWQGWQHQLDNGNNAIATRATMSLQQWQRFLDWKDACASTTATPSQWGQQRQLDNSKGTCTLMMATTSLLQGQQRQLNDYASLTMAETPSQWGQQLSSQWQQRRLRINCNNAITTRATTPS